MNQTISSDKLDETRQKLISYEDKIIDKYIECMEHRNPQLLDVDDLVEELNRNISDSYHFVVSDLLYYFTIIIVHRLIINIMTWIYFN